MKYLQFVLFFTFNLSLQVSEETYTKDDIKEKIKDDNADYNRIKRNDLILERDNLNTLLKTLHYSCIVLARFQISTYGSKLMDLLQKHKSEDDQNKLWRYIYINHVLQCQKTITYDDSVKIFTYIKANEFDLSIYDSVFSDYSLNQFEDVSPKQIQFNKDDNKTWKYIESFEKSMKDKQQEKEEDEDSLSRQKHKIKQFPQELETKVFGFSLKNSHSLVIISLLLFVLALSGIFYFMCRGLQEKQPKKKNKKRI